QKYSFFDEYTKTNCLIENIPVEFRTEWQYWYNSAGEREQKRLYYAPSGDQNGKVYPWVYYSLGLQSEQLAVYNGVQISDQIFQDENGNNQTNNTNFLQH